MLHPYPYLCGRPGSTFDLRRGPGGFAHSGGGELRSALGETNHRAMDLTTAGSIARHGGAELPPPCAGTDSALMSGLCRAPRSPGALGGPDGTEGNLRRRASSGRSIAIKPLETLSGCCVTPDFPARTLACTGGGAAAGDGHPPCAAPSPGRSLAHRARPGLQLGLSSASRTVNAGKGCWPAAGIGHRSRRPKPRRGGAFRRQRAPRRPSPRTPTLPDIHANQTPIFRHT